MKDHPHLQKLEQPLPHHYLHIASFSLSQKSFSQNIEQSGEAPPKVLEKLLEEWAYPPLTICQPLVLFNHVGICVGLNSLLSTPWHYTTFGQ